MRADLKQILSSDPAGDREYGIAARPDPLDAFGWFQVEIGDDASEGGEWFSVLVATPAAVPRAQGDRKFHGLVVPVFEPEAIEAALRDFVASVAGSSW